MDKSSSRFILILGALVVISLVPVVYVMPFTRMCLDDFVYAANTHITWVKTHSIPAILATAVSEVKTFYLNWQGAWIPDFFFAFNGGSFAEKYYWINLIIHFLIFTYSIWKMSDTLCRTVLNLDRPHSLTVFFTVLFFSVQFVPDSTDAFYAFNLCVMYTGHYSFALIMMSYVLLFLLNEDKGKGALPFACIFGLLSGSGHLSIGVMAFTFVLFASIYAFISGNHRKWKTVLISLFVLAALLINALAPGYKARSSGIDYGMSLFSAIGFSVVHSFEMINSFMTIYTFTALGIIFYVIMSGVIRDNQREISFKMLVFISVWIFATYASMFAANYYAIGSALYPRLIDVAYFSFFWAASFCFVLWSRKLVERHHTAVTELYCSLQKMIVTAKPICTTAALAGLICIGILSTGKLDAILGFNLARRIINGDVKRYAEARDQWISICEAHTGEDVIVEELPVYIDAIDKWHVGLDEDGPSWVNGAIAKYYQLSSFDVKYR